MIKSSFSFSNLSLTFTIFILLNSFLFKVVWTKCSNHYFKKVPVIVDGGLYAFNFGEAGVPVPLSFEFFSKQSIIVSVFDCYCSGDDFFLYLDGQLFYNTGSPPGNCLYYSDDPYVCYNQIGGFWSRMDPLVPAGRHNVTIAPYKSPNGKGTAFLRVSTACGTFTCCYVQTLTDNCNYKIVKEYD